MSKKFNRNDLLNLSNLEHSLIAFIWMENEVYWKPDDAIMFYIDAKKKVNEAIERMLRDE